MDPFKEDDEAWPDEPSEFDPDSLAPDPPGTAGGTRSSLSAAEDVPEGLFQAFWASVLLLNVALAATAIGAMLIYFQGAYETGTLTLAIGTVAALGTLRYYWAVKTGRYKSSTGEGDAAGEEL